MTTERYVRSSTDHLDASVENGAAVLDPRSGEVFQLNASGHWLWQRLAQPASLGELVREAGERFEDSASAAQQIESFLQALLQRGLLRRLD